MQDRRWPLPRWTFLIPFLWFLYDWLWAVWLVDLAMLRRGQRETRHMRKAFDHGMVVGAV